MAEELLDVAAGFRVTPPDGWEAGREGGRMFLSRAGGTALVVAVPHAASGAEDVRPLLEQGWQEAGLELAPAGPPEEREASVVVDLAGTANGQEAVGSLMLTWSPHGGGVLLIGVAPSGDVRSVVETVAATIRFFEPDPSELLASWRERLVGRKLVYLSHYSSGGMGGGIQERHELFLHPDGRFEQEGEFVASFGDAGSAIEQAAPPIGEWRLEALAGQAILRLEGEGEPTEYLLSETNGEVFLNGRRYFVTDA